jgi:arylsulfatase A-like enzyme
LFNREATADDVTERALRWLADRPGETPVRPFFLWVHYVEPHAPYRYHRSSGEALGIAKRQARKSDRYDTEVHAVDRAIGELLDGLQQFCGRQSPLIAFSADHGESLGEHGYWGHGRHLFEPSLRIPMALIWPDHIRPGTIDEPVLIIDLAPTILDLLSIDSPAGFAGLSWAGPLDGEAPSDRPPLCFQAHKGAVKVRHDSARARSRGLLEVGVISGHFKEVLEVKKARRHLVFDIERDPAELHNLASILNGESEALMECFGDITSGLGALDRLSVSRLSDENREMLRSLGYLN